MARVIDKNGIVFADAVLRLESAECVQDGSTCGFVVAQVGDMVGRDVQLRAEVLFHSIRIGDGPAEVVDGGRFVLVDTYDQSVKWGMPGANVNR